MDTHFTDLVCVGGTNDGRRMRVYEKHKRRYIGLALLRSREAQPGTTTITVVGQEFYSLTSICGVEVYLHSSLSPHTGMERIMQHYQRRP